jgi:DNA-binding IclR family transcriptional regulator
MSEQEGVAAVDRALSILDAITEDRITLAELSKRTGLYKSTVLRLLKSLEKAGYVLRTADGQYRLGARVLSLGALYQRHFRTSDIVPPVLERLAAELLEGASFYIRENEQRVCLHRADSSRSVRDSVHVGDRLPLTAGASGHVLRAFAGAVGPYFDQVRLQMFAASYGERDAETAAMAAPVFAQGNSLVGAIAVSGPRYRLESLGEDAVRPVLLRYAKELTHMLGGNVLDPRFQGWGQSAPAVAAIGHHAAAPAAPSAAPTPRLRNPR